MPWCPSFKKQPISRPLLRAISHGVASPPPKMQILWQADLVAIMWLLVTLIMMIIRLSSANTPPKASVTQKTKTSDTVAGNDV
jgi:hypothetical protein